MTDNEFGFSLISESDIKANEEILKNKIEETLAYIEEQNKYNNELKSKQQELTDKLWGLRNMVMPFLENLTKDPDKTYILWEDRVPKVNEFIDKINKYVEE